MHYSASRGEDVLYLTNRWLYNFQSCLKSCDDGSRLSLGVDVWLIVSCPVRAKQDFFSTSIPTPRLSFFFRDKDQDQDFLSQDQDQDQNFSCMQCQIVWHNMAKQNAHVVNRYKNVKVTINNLQLCRCILKINPPSRVSTGHKYRPLP